jgi:hypothetical protein
MPSPGSGGTQTSLASMVSWLTSCFRADVRGGRVYSPLSVARQRCAPAGPPSEPSAASLLRCRFRHKWNSCFCVSLAVCSVFGKNIFNRPRRHLQSLET